MKTIMLHGQLKQFGEQFSLNVDSAAEACHALSCQLPEFKKFMLTAEQDGMRFAVFLDEVNEQGNIGERDISNHTGASVIHIVPRIMGAGGDALGWLQVVAGAALIAFSGGLGSAQGLAMIGAGVGLMVGGAASLLMPTPEIESQDEDGNRANYGFGGAVTTVAQGNPVPILYGERYIGGFICSAGIYTEDNQ
ncbi:tail assembly protein [Psychrobacter sp. Rd 27.2]|uniref:tail assembly protein n=1 Tax=Psychrobacter sp. Rd 27.2 TaxID=1926479 RepID=UPI000946DAE1|nr:tail assembly protein [Psychrobacter sp. Rd 27.2]OLF40778.1 phage tail protein [Psychrobacter sp. Rd 27.2]